MTTHYKYKASELLESYSILSVVVESTGLCGGDAGHGGRTRVTLTNESSFDFDGSETNNEIVVRCAGDDELQNLALALDFAAKSLFAFISASTKDPRP
jgi:hypothetical protein